MSLQGLSTLRSPNYAGPSSRQPLPLFELGQVAPRAPAKLTNSPQDRRDKTWFDDIFRVKDRTQIVIPLAKMGDWQSRLIINNGATAFQPAGLTFKVTLAELALSKNLEIRLANPNFTGRWDSHWKSEFGATIQGGLDYTQASLEKQLELARAGQPIMAMAFVKRGVEADTSGYRIELGFKADSLPKFKSVVRSALKAGQSVGVTFMWLDPKTRVKLRVDATFVAKAEAAGETGLSTKPEPYSARAEVEVQLRFASSNMEPAGYKSILKSTEMISRWAADYLHPYTSPSIDTINQGSEQTARYNITHKLVSGTPVWQLLPHTGGKNHGHPVIDLALRVNALLRSQKRLPSDAYVTSLADASSRLRALWDFLRPAERERLAPQLVNRLNLNFGLPEVAGLNQAAFEQLPMTGKDRTYRALFR
jgi:hypothetical protein